MQKQINKVAVLGAGTMGARISAHLANAGVPSYLFDSVPPDADGPTRNRFAAAGLEGAIKSKPAAFFKPSLASLVTIGNFEDELDIMSGYEDVVDSDLKTTKIDAHIKTKISRDKASKVQVEATSRYIIKFISSSN